MFLEKTELGRIKFIHPQCPVESKQQKLGLEPKSSPPPVLFLLIVYDLCNGFKYMFRKWFNRLLFKGQNLSSPLSNSYLTNKMWQKWQAWDFPEQVTKSTAASFRLALWDGPSGWNQLHIARTLKEKSTGWGGRASCQPPGKSASLKGFLQSQMTEPWARTTQTHCFPIPRPQKPCITRLVVWSHYGVCLGAGDFSASWDTTDKTKIFKVHILGINPLRHQN